MEKNVDVYRMLRIVAVVTRYGSREGDEYELDGLRCIMSPDGYTVTLSDGVVNLTVFFHNTFELEYKTDDQLEQFQRKINHVEQQDQQGFYSQRKPA